MDNTMRKLASIALAAALALCSLPALAGCAGSNVTGAQVVKLDPDNPVTLTLWHYYNGPQQEQFDQLVDEFNETEGLEQGIRIETTSHGSIADLENDVIDAAEGEVGAASLPDIFSTYNDVAAEILNYTELVNIADYFSGDELSQYVDAYIQDGYIASDSNLYVFPVAKSSEVLMVSKAEWKKFSKACDVSLEDLSTEEGIAQVAQKYYEYTDGLTPKVKDDGKSLYGRDSLANYFLASFAQMGADLVTVKNGSATLNTDKDLYKRIWDTYYVPYVKGYYTAKGKFRSDDVKTGDIISYTGSTASASYFPTQADGNTTSTQDSAALVSMPAVMEGGKQVVIQQGAGMAVVKSDETKQYAASVFLKWFTQPSNNLRFVAEAGYLPVTKEANNTEALDAVTKDNDIQISSTVYETLKNFMDNFESTSFYSYPSFKNATELRDVLEESLSASCQADKKAVDKKVAKGVSRAKAQATYISDEAFDSWYTKLVESLQSTLDKQ